MGQFIDLTGKTYGKLTVIGSPRHNKYWQYEWLCQCECGRTKYIAGYNLKCGNTTSCGCERDKRASIGMKNYHKKRDSRKSP